MFQRPHSTLVQDQHILKPNATATQETPNGAAQAANELFPAEPSVADPQMDKAVSLGTTIMAVTFNGGVVLAADSRTSTGAYVANRTSNKLTKVTDNIYCCRSGSAADTQAIAEICSSYLEQQEIVENRTVSVSSAANLFQLICFNNKYGISAGIIVAGWDPANGGSAYLIPSGGSCLRLPFALGGSGSIFLYSFMDVHYKDNMSKEECLALCRTAVAHALTRDGSSGGVVRTIALTAEGAEHETTPWTAHSYVLERDPKYAKLLDQNPPFLSNSVTKPNVTDGSQN